MSALLAFVAGAVVAASLWGTMAPQFEAAALAAIRQWKFEPGKRAGKPVRFRMRQPFTFK